MWNKKNKDVKTTKIPDEKNKKQPTGAEFILPKLLDDFFMNAKGNNKNINQEEFVKFIAEKSNE